MPWTQRLVMERVPSSTCLGEYGMHELFKVEMAPVTLICKKGQGPPQCKPGEVDWNGIAKIPEGEPALPQFGFGWP